MKKLRPSASALQRSLADLKELDTLLRGMITDDDVLSEMRSPSGKEYALSRACINPDIYFRFQNFDVLFDIVVDKDVVADGSFSSFSDEPLYHIRCFNYIPSFWHVKRDNAQYFRFGNYTSLDELVKYDFCKCVIDYLCSVNSFYYMEGLF